jgi:NAD(P)-dependent dehydrogenase (short-subunit alcohol dehydrogenase family)
MSSGSKSNNQFSMHGKAALITGAGRGIGLAMAQALAAQGCAVAIQDIEPDVAVAEARKIEQAGGRALALGGDIRDLSLPAKLVEETRRHLGGLHVLINNAAIQLDKPWLEQASGEMVEQFSADVVSPILFCQAAVPIFRAQKWGRIINLGSVTQRKGAISLLPYSLSKAALVTLTTALANDLAADQITVNMIAPGYFNTHRNRSHFPDAEAIARGGQHVPSGRVGRPEDCGPIALLLCSDAGEHITGQTIYVDGGISARWT